MGNSLAFTDLEPGADYAFEVSTVCAVLESDTTALDTVKLNCPPPEIVATVTDPYTATLAKQGGWNSALIQDMLFAVRPLGEEEWTYHNRAAYFNFTTVSELNDLTDYEAMAYQVCEVGDTSAWSVPIQFSTPVDCRVPEELGVEELYVGGADVRWDVTGSVTQWEVRYRDHSPD